MPGLSEIERGRSEAAHTVLAATEVHPYLAPRADTPFPLRYAFYLLGDIRQKIVLDLGCGSGENLAPPLARGANAIAIDLSEELVQLARKRLAMANPQRILPDGSVDAILCSSLLHHLDIPRAMAEMKRLLKPSGFAVVKEPVRCWARSKR